jgi:hypothetical protein
LVVVFLSLRVGELAPEAAAEVVVVSGTDTVAESGSERGSAVGAAEVVVVVEASSFSRVSILLSSSAMRSCCFSIASLVDASASGCALLFSRSTS